MGLDAWLTLLTICGCFGALAFSRLPADAILLGGAAILLLFGVLDVQGALIGFSNEGVATVAVLYIVAHALVATGAVGWLSQYILGRPSGLRLAQLRLMLPVAVFSSLLNNTPVVAMMVPAVSDWARRLRLPASQLMMPLSFAAMIGGTCTLIGTSTNLVINGMLKQSSIEAELAIFDLAWVGIPCVIAVVVFILLFSRHLLPVKQGAAARFEDARQYVVEMIVEPASSLTGKSIADAGLRHLPGLFLVEIVRNDRVMPVVSPAQVLMADDRLVFAGNVDSVVDLKQLAGLRSAEHQVFKLDAGESERTLIEVVIAPDFPLLGKTVKEGNFRKFYSAVIIALLRDGKQVKERIGDVNLQPGDTLLLESNDQFVRKQRYAKDFLVVSPVANFQPIQDKKRWVSIGILVVMVVLVSLGLVSMFKAAVLAAAAMVVSRCCSMNGARRSISWQVLAAIAASLALGKAIEDTGLASMVADALVSTAAGSPFASLVAVFVLTALFSALITNVAAAVLLFPIALATAQDLGVSAIPFAVTIMVAASSSFSTPMGYQTNMMVWGPGDYRFNDFVKLGVPLTVLVGIVTVSLVPLIWPFSV